MNIREFLKERPLLFDGAMGTYYAARNHCQALHCELANLTAPGEIEAIHRAYRKVGCDAIKTNTFGVNRMNYTEEECLAVLNAGVAIANRAAEGAFVFGDIGPITLLGEESLFEEYRFIIDRLLANGISHFLFETHPQDFALHEAAAYIKERNPDAFILCSFAVQPDGFTIMGESAQALLHRAALDSNVDAAGINCVSGASHMIRMLDSLDTEGLVLSVLPNAGYPTVVGGRTLYNAEPAYYARQMAVIAAKGASILGGCCGTTPDHIAATALVLRNMNRILPEISHHPENKPKPYRESHFWDALCDPEQRPFAVELDPPETAEVKKFVAGAKELQTKGACVITIADCPVARPRMDASLLACKLTRELQIETLPHMTCRDRNLNAIKGLLLGLSAERVKNVLVVTGDPIPNACRDEVKSVYNFNSRLLAGYITALKQTVLPAQFHVFGALNVNAPNFHVQLEIAKEKVEKGVCGFLTQPVLTAQALENLKLARRELDAKILGGIFPIVSHRNAQFIHSEVTGIVVDPRIIDLYRGLDRAEGEALALRISTEIGRELAPYVDGFYLITPFNRTGLVAKIMERFRAEGLAK